MQAGRVFGTIALGLAVAGCKPAAIAPVIRIDGSSTVFPVIEAVAEEFQSAKRGAVRVTVGIAGTGGGFKKFCRGETDISNASRPILRSEMDACARNGVRYIEMPVAFDALTVVVNPNNSLSAISIEDLKKIWEPAAQGRVLRWNQANPAFADAPLKLYGAGADSGTFDYFTEAVTGKAKASRGDFTASEDDNVLVQGVSRDINALGFFGFAYYQENRDKLKGLAISWKGGRPVAPTAQTVIDGSYQPLSRPIFVYVSEASAGKPEVREFVEFFNRNAASLIEEIKFVPLPQTAYEHNLEALATRQVGSKFGGENKVGLTIDELIRLEAKL